MVQSRFNCCSYNVKYKSKSIVCILRSTNIMWYILYEDGHCVCNCGPSRKVSHIYPTLRLLPSHALVLSRPSLPCITTLLMVPTQSMCFRGSPLRLRYIRCIPISNHGGRKYSSVPPSKWATSFQSGMRYKETLSAHDFGLP